jgi:hypothetical protein
LIEGHPKRRFAAESRASVRARGSEPEPSTAPYVFATFRAVTLACYLAIALGMAFRLLQLFADRGLSQDEAQLALNIMHRSFSGLFHQLDFQQAAPEGFLAIQKIDVWGLGSSEYALRLAPFVAGSLALVMIFFLARNVVSLLAVPLATAFFAVSDPLINWTVYDKQYAIDVLLSVVLLWIGFRMSDQPDHSSTVLLYAGVGTVAVWLSHPSVFTLAGISTALVAGSLVRKDLRHALLVVAASAAWLASFGVFALTYSQNLVYLQTVLRGGSGAFGGSGQDSLDSLRGGFGEFRYASGIPHFLQRGGVDAGQLIFIFAAAFCTIGFIRLVRRNPVKAVALLAPLGFMLIAWGIQKYPLLGRTQLFLVPNFVLLLAEGIVYMVTRAQGASARAASAALAGVVGLALATPAIGHVAHPRRLGDLKPVLRYLAREQRPNDTLYIYYTAEAQFRYYLECACAGATFETRRRAGLWPAIPGPGGEEPFAPALLSVPPRLIVAPYRGKDPSSYTSDLEALRGRKRVWILLSSLDDRRTKRLLRELDRRGKQRASFITGEGENSAAVYLYDLTHPRP